MFSEPLHFIRYFDKCIILQKMLKQFLTTPTFIIELPFIKYLDKCIILEKKVEAMLTT